MKTLLCPSMMCADFGNIKREIEELEQAGADVFHLDVMDGSFVPNFGLGMQEVEYICKHSSIPCDVHLMIDNPSDYINRFAELGIKIIYVHPESDKHITNTLKKIKDLGLMAGIAVNPGTSFEGIKECLYLVDYVIIMTVNPGFAGQKYLDFVDNKLKKFIEERENYNNYKILLDGACSLELMQRFKNQGVDGYVLGTSVLFKKNIPYKEIIKNIRKEI